MERVKHAATFKHTLIELREHVNFDCGFDFVRIGLFDGADDCTGLIIIIDIRTAGTGASHTTEEVAFRADDITESGVGDKADITVFDEFFLCVVFVTDLTLERLVVDFDAESEIGEVLFGIANAHIEHPLIERFVLFESIPSDLIHDEDACGFAVVGELIGVDETFDVTEGICGGIAPIRKGVYDVMIGPFAIAVEIRFDHTKRTVVRAVVETELTVLEKLCAEVFGVGGNTVHQFQIIFVFIIEDGEGFGACTVLFEISVDFAQFRCVNLNTFAELRNLVVLEGQFARTTDGCFGIGIAQVQDNVGVLITFDGSDFFFNRAFVRHEGRQLFRIVGLTNTSPDGEQVDGIPIFRNQKSHI